VLDAGKMALGDYLDGWLGDSVKDTVRQRTYERYESIVRVHIRPAIGRVQLKALTPAHARALYRQKLDSGLSPRTVNYIHVTLHKALSQAVSDGLVPRNAASVKAPRPEKPEIKPLSPDQARKLVATAREIADRYEALYVLALHCGLRAGELLGLKWSDVDFSGPTATVQVRRTLSETRTGHKFEKPKNGKGRSVKLSQKATEALRSHRARQGEESRLGWVLCGRIMASCSRPRRGPPRAARTFWAGTSSRSSRGQSYPPSGCTILGTPALRYSLWQASIPSKCRSF
jgi:integrase